MTLATGPLSTSRLDDRALPAEMLESVEPEAVATDTKVPDLAELMAAFTGVTERLQDAHRVLQGEVRRLKNQLRDTNEQLRRSRQLAALGQMAAGIAHEIRNPLGSIRLYANMLTEDLDDQPDAQRLAQRIEQAVGDLNGIVCDVLDFSRDIKVRPVELDVDDLWRNALESCQGLLHESQITIEKNNSTDGAGPKTVVADPILLNQALVNLIRNAIQAMEGTGTLSLSATLAMVPDSDDADEEANEEETLRVILSVRDTGPGIDGSMVERIFNPFFTTRPTGTGLGLAIVHRIVDAHGGAIDISNHATGGAVVSVSLPASVSRTEPELQDTPGEGHSPLASDDDRDEGLAA